MFNVETNRKIFFPLEKIVKIHTEKISFTMKSIVVLKVDVFLLQRIIKVYCSFLAVFN